VDTSIPLQLTDKLIIRLHQHDLRCPRELKPDTQQPRCPNQKANIPVTLPLSSWINCIRESIYDIGLLASLHSAGDHAYTILLLGKIPLNELYSVSIDGTGEQNLLISEQKPLAERL
jgi:hypothetical protein